MSKGAYDIYALVIKFLGFDWQTKHIAIELVETFDTSRHALPKDLIKLLCKYDSRKKIITCVWFNLNTITPALKFNISCDVLGLTKSFQGSYFGHAFFKAC
jgi:hypothetical protein